MPKQLTWDDAEDIGILLSETHPELDPLAVRFTDLHRYVTELPDFKGDPKARTKASWKRFRWPGTKKCRTARRADFGSALGIVLEINESSAGHWTRART